MFLGLIKDSRFLPTEYYDSIFEINFEDYYNKGIRVILTDLDNTFISYKEKEPKEDHFKLVKRLKELGFEIVIVSNNSSNKRVKHFATLLDLKYTHFALKPTKIGYKKAMKKLDKKYLKDEVMTIGDQLMTDIFSSNRMGFTSILVKAIDKKTEVLTTRINRALERHAITRIGKKDIKAFEKHLAKYWENNYAD